MLEAYNPINKLISIDEDIWIVNGPVIKMKMFWKIFFSFQTRMTVIRLSSGEMWLHSPIEYNDELAAEISRMGTVKYLVAPNKLHYSYINQWHKHFPNALLYEAPGVAERASKNQINIQFDKTLHDDIPQEWSADLKQILFKGSRYMEEAVFFHKKSRTLILVDFIENFELEKASGWFRWVLKLGKFYHPFGKHLPIYNLLFGKIKKLPGSHLEQSSYGIQIR